MKNKTNIVGMKVQDWIAIDDLPTGPRLRAIKTNDPNFGLSDDEIEAWSEFISWYLQQSILPLLAIPVQQRKDSFYVPDCMVTDDEYSVFNTHDFQSRINPINRHAYAMKKLLERVEDLAILYSVLSDEIGRSNIYRRYRLILEQQFGDRLERLAELLSRTEDACKSRDIHRQIQGINRQIDECEHAWAKWAQYLS